MLIQDPFIQGGYQEDAEEFFGFFLDTLEEELDILKASISPKAKPTSEPTEEQEGWHEVGKNNKAVEMRTVNSVLKVGKNYSHAD